MHFLCMLHLSPSLFSCNTTHILFISGFFLLYNNCEVISIKLNHNPACTLNVQSMPWSFTYFVAFYQNMHQNRMFPLPPNSNGQRNKTWSKMSIVIKLRWGGLRTSSESYSHLNACSRDKTTTIPYQ